MGTRPTKALQRGRLRTRAGAVVTTISLPATLHRRAAVAAATRGVVLTAVFRDAVADWLDRHDRRRA